MREETTPEAPGSEFLYDALVDAGIQLLVGLPGTQTLPIDRTVARRDDVTYVMARHETAIPHVAWGYYEASGRVAATLTVPGPGDTNAVHGLKNALDDNVPIIHVSPVSDPETLGNHPIHELDDETFDHVVKANLTVDRPNRLREVINRGIETALSPPYGPIRLAIPSGFLERPIDAPPASVRLERTTYETADAVADTADRLANAQRPLVYVGGGVRRSDGGPGAAADLAAALNAPVAASYKGKGVFPEDDDRFLGVTGADMPAGARAAFDAADVVIALGTDFDGPNTEGWSLPVGNTLVRVEINPAETNTAYDPDVLIVDDAARVCDDLAAALRTRALASTWDGAALGAAVHSEYSDRLDELGHFDEGTPLSSPAILRAVREALPSETVVTTDIGGHRIWSKNCFPVFSPETFVTAGSWAGMGVGLPSAVGAKLARPDRPVATLTGDGSLMMCAQELHTAAEEGIDLTVILFTDADYGIISKSLPDDERRDGHGFDWTSPDWGAIAEGYGCRARSVRTRTELQEAVAWSLDADGPTLIDVAVDPTEPTPYETASYETEIDPWAF